MRYYLRKKIPKRKKRFKSQYEMWNTFKIFFTYKLSHFIFVFNQKYDFSKFKNTSVKKKSVIRRDGGERSL